MKQPTRPKRCKAIAEGSPDWMRCQLGRGHSTPMHIYADRIYVLQWSKGKDGYVPEECPDPAVHEEYYG